MPTTLRQGWYSREHSGFDPQLPGIYEWRIEGVGLYIGKAKKLRSRIRSYPNNVRCMLDGLPWHGNPDREYRRVHHALLKAYVDGRQVEVTILENCDENARAEREQYWIRRRREEAALGGPPVLN